MDRHQDTNTETQGNMKKEGSTMPPKAHSTALELDTKLKDIYEMNKKCDTRENRPKK